MREIYIIGSGGLAKEIFVLINQINGFEVKGFVDIIRKNPLQVGSKFLPVISEDNLMAMKNGSISLAIGVGEPNVIDKVTQKFSGFFEFPNIIHPTVTANWDDIKLGAGNIFTANVVLTTSIKIGSFNLFNLSCTIGHDAVIGDCNVLNPTVNISGGVIIGNQNLIGVRATILQYKRIGHQNVIGGASLVTKDIENNTVVIGVPAKKMEKK